MTELYAKIKKSSKYYWSQHDPENPYFAVSITDDCEGYNVIGGAGGQYRLADVSLYAKVDDKYIVIKR